MRNLILYSLFLFFTLQLTAQKDSLLYDKSNINIKKFDQANLNKYSSDRDFKYQEAKQADNFITRALDWLGKQFLKFLEWLFGERRAGGIFGIVLTILPYFIAFLMLLLLIKIFVNVQTESILTGTTKSAKIKFGEEEELIKNSDIDALITKSLKQKNFRLAIRYHFLKALQLLERKHHIVWEQQKTNHDYENEITKPNLQAQFRAITYLYDFVWYGNFDLEEADFNQAKNLFTRLETELTKQN